MTSQFQSLREENKKIHPLVCWLVRHCALTDTATTDSFAVQVKCTVSDKLDRHARCKQLYKIRLVGGELSFQQEDLNPNLLKAVTVGFFLLHLARLHLTQLRVFTQAQTSIHQYWPHS